jgi:hypothetical protein
MAEIFLCAETVLFWTLATASHNKQAFREMYLNWSKALRNSVSNLLISK